MKRKYGSRYDWKRIVERGYTERYIDEERFKGYVSLLHMVEVTEPLYIQYGSKSICVVDDGYYWMHHFPESEHYTVTTTFNANGHVVQWYIDISKGVGYCEENGPWMDDWILDLVLLPDGQVIELDVDEFEEARAGKLLQTEDFEKAWDEFIQLKEKLLTQRFKLVDQTVIHFNELRKSLPVIEQAPQNW